mgnify:CR=1 FL=1
MLFRSIPDDSLFTAIGTDVGGKVAHWVCLSFRENGRIHVVDYGTTGVVTKGDTTFDIAIEATLKRLHERLSLYEPKLWYVDSHWKPIPIIAAIKAVGDRKIRPIFGLGSGQVNTKKYRHPRGGKTRGYTWVGDEASERYRRDYGMICCSVNSDYYKTELHRWLDADPPGVTLYESTDEKEQDRKSVV